MTTTSDVHTSITFVPLWSTDHARRGHVCTQGCGLLVYEAVYAGPRAAPVSLGLFVSRESAEHACRRAVDSGSTHIDLEGGVLRVDERLLENDLDAARTR